MPSIKTIFFVKLLLCWNWISEYVYSIINNTSDFISHVLMYFKNDKHSWLFISGHSLPLQRHNIYNKINAKWEYNCSSNKLTYLYDKSESFYTINWLSASIITDLEDKKTEYEMDSFLNDFKIYTTEENYPTIAELFNCWCIHTKHWFSPMMKITIHHIDMIGEEHDIVINESDVVFIKSDKNYISLHHNK